MKNISYFVSYDLKNGIIPRVIEDIFIQKNQSDEIYVSYLEIYKNKLIYLLINESAMTKNVLEIKKNTEGTYVKNLTEIKVSNIESVFDIISKSSKLRKIATTSKNDSSSRSHAIFTIYIFDNISNKKTKFGVTSVTKDTYGYLHCKFSKRIAGRSPSKDAV